MWLKKAGGLDQPHDAKVFAISDWATPRNPWHVWRRKPQGKMSLKVFQGQVPEKMLVNSWLRKKHTFTYSSGPCTSSLPLFLLFSGPTDWRTRGRWVALRRSQWARRWSRTSSTWWRGSWARGCGGRGPRREWGRIWRWRWSPGTRRLDLCLRNDRPPGEGTALCHRSKLAPERQIQVYNIIDWSSDQGISYVFERELLIKSP